MPLPVWGGKPSRQARLCNVAFALALLPFMHLLGWRNLVFRLGGVAALVAAPAAVWLLAMAVSLQLRKRSPTQRVSLGQEVLLRASARQVFDVQWSVAGCQLSAANFRRPAGTGSTGFQRPDVDVDSDRYELIASTTHSGQYALLQLDGAGNVKSQLTTHGHVKAIGAEVMLYIGDGHWGTLILLTEEREYGFSGAFDILMFDPPSEIVKGMLGAAPKLCNSVGLGAQAQHKFHGNVKWPSSEEVVDRQLSGSSDEVLVPMAGTMDALRAVSHQHGRRVTFKSVISLKEVKCLSEIVVDGGGMCKDTMWWQQEDFADFLAKRLEIGQAYKEAARKLGVDVLSVTSVGSHGSAAYTAMIQRCPGLKDESRRGLGLGRKKQRASNRDKYIRAVKDEQDRQREVQSSEELRMEAIAEVARHVSEKDRAYAHHLAVTYYEQDRTAFGDDGLPDFWRAGADNDSPFGVRRGSDAIAAQRSLREEILAESDPPFSPVPESPLSIDRSDSCSIESNDSTESYEVKMADPDLEATHARPNSKGFGLSRDALQLAGLSCTGHAISRGQRLRALPSHDDDGASSAEESEVDF